MGFLPTGLAAQVTLSIGDQGGSPTTASPHGFVLPNTMTLAVSAPALPSAVGAIGMSMGLTGSNPTVTLAPGLTLNLAPSLVIFDVFVLSGAGSSSRVLPIPFTLPQAVGVTSAFWQVAVADPSQPGLVSLSNGIETPVVAGTPSWQQLFPSGGPPPGRSSAGVLYDPVGQRVILSHGSTGFGGGVFQDTWSLSLGGATPSWSNLLPGGPIPATRWGNTLVRDPVGVRLILFGGSVQGFIPSSDVHVISLQAGASAVWAPLSPGGTAPPGRRSHSAIFDPLGKRMVIFGGGTGFFPGATTLGDLWALDFTGSPLGAWIQLNPGGGPAPQAREVHTAIYDALNHRMVIYGGVAQGGASLADVWALSLQPGTETWTQLFPTGGAPAARNSHSAIYDAPNQRMVVFGGIVANANTAAVLSLVLAPGLESWQVLSPTGGGPAARDSHLAVFDSVNRRMIIHAGFTMFPSAPFQDVWALELQ